jgi:HSP20 family molecular chaperone IbpA
VISFPGAGRKAALQNGPKRSDQQHPLVSLHRDVNRLFDDVFRGFGVPATSGWGRSLEWPTIELSETDKEIRVTAELPGMDEKDVNISVDDNVLSIRGEKRSKPRTRSVAIRSGAMVASSGISGCRVGSSRTGQARRSTRAC